MSIAKGSHDRRERFSGIYGSRVAQVSVVTVVVALVGIFATMAAGSTGKASRTSAPPSVFRVGLAERFNDLNVDTALQNDELEVINEISANLTRFTPNASAVVPGLARSWSISKNGKKYTFHLRPNLKFSNGAALTAGDVVGSFNYFMTDKNNGAIGLFAAIAKVSAPDSRTVVLTLKHSSGSMLQLLAQPNFMIVPASQVKKKGFWLKPISAGPYMVSSFSPGSKTVLVRNPNFYGSKASIPRLEFIYVNDTNTRIVELKGGQFDLVQNLPPNTVNQLSGSTVAVHTTLFGAWYFYVNIRHSPLSSVKVRQAISLAVNRKQLRDSVWGGKPALLYGFYPTSMRPWHQDTLARGPNASRAKALLAGTACANGCTLNLLVRNDSSYYQDMAAIVQQNLSGIGIKLNLQQTDAATAGSDEYKGNFELAIGGLTDYSNIPDGFLVYGLKSDGGIYGLFAGYKSKKMDAYIAAVLNGTGRARLTAMRKINALYAKDLPSIPLLDWDWINGMRTDVQQWVTPTPSSFIYVRPLG